MEGSRIQQKFTMQFQSRALHALPVFGNTNCPMLSTKRNTQEGIAYIRFDIWLGQQSVEHGSSQISSWWTTMVQKQRLIPPLFAYSKLRRHMTLYACVRCVTSLPFVLLLGLVTASGGGLAPSFGHGEHSNANSSTPDTGIYRQISQPIQIFSSCIGNSSRGCSRDLILIYMSSSLCWGCEM
jgi:hypothetical protein